MLEVFEDLGVSHEASLVSQERLVKLFQDGMATVEQQCIYQLQVH